MANPVNFLEIFLTKVYQYTDILSCTVKLCDEVCISDTKRVGDNKTVFTTQEVRKSAVHWFIPFKI